MIKNKLVNEAFDELLKHHSLEESSYMILNSLAILGAKKVQILSELTEASYISINKYKYPERLALFLKTTNEKTLEWQALSFAKIALS